MAHQITVIPDDKWKEAAKKWRKELLLMVVFAMQESTRFLQGLPGCRTNQFLGGVNVDAQFMPYAANKRGDGSTKIDYREMLVSFGCMNQDFVPNDYVQTLLGEMAATMGDGMKAAPSAKLVIANVLKQAGENLALALFDAKYKASGTTSKDLFNGFNTIAEAEIAAGNIAGTKGNFLQLTEDITNVNAVDVLKQIEFGLDLRLRAQERFLYCDPAIVDKYNEDYLVGHNGLVYNEKYEQAFVEGSNRKMTFAPLPALAGSKLMYVAPRMNMVYGYDTMGDVERLEVLRLDVDTLTLAAKMFFGTQFRTLDKRYLKVIKLKTT